MREGRDRSPAIGLVKGLAVGVGGWIVLWQAYLQWERTMHAAQSTFEFRRPGFVWAQLLFALAGALYGVVIMLAVRDHGRSRVWTLIGGAIPPLSILSGFWYWMLGGRTALFHGWVLKFTLEPETQAAAAVAVGTLLAVAAASFIRRSGD